MTVDGSVVLTMSINAGGKSGNTCRAFCRSKNRILLVNRRLVGSQTFAADLLLKRSRYR